MEYNKLLNYVIAAIIVVAAANALMDAARSPSFPPFAMLTKL